MNQPIPLNLFTGFLGSGKTTTIANLVKKKPKHEKWGILVNEFGDVAIDQSFLTESSSQNLFVKEIPGGCMCCDAWLLLQVSLVRLIKEFRPNRILVEMTGLGHPYSVIKQLTGSTMQNTVELINTICLVDPNQYSNEKFYTYPSYVDQIAIADIVLITKSASVSSDRVQKMISDIETGYSPKKHIETLPFGMAPFDLLKKEDHQQRGVHFPDFHSHSHHHSSHSSESNEHSDEIHSHVASAISKGSPQRYENIGQDHMGCGWIFSSQDLFHHDRLVQLVKQIMKQGCLRIKGIFITTDSVLSINAITGFLDIRCHTLTEDSRVEILCSKDSSINWQEIEKQFLSCLT